MHSSATGGQPSGSDRYRVLGSTGAHLRFASALRASCRPVSIHRLAPTSLLRLGRQPTSIRIELRPSALLATASGLRRMLLLLPRLASTSGSLRLLLPSGFTGRRSLGLRLAIYSPVEPPMHSLLQTEPCIAGLAVDEYSVFHRLLHLPESPSSNNFRLAPSFASSGASSDPSQACARGFTLCPGWRPPSGSHRLFTPPALLAIRFRLAPTASLSSFRRFTSMPYWVISCMRHYVRSICGFKCKSQVNLWISPRLVQRRIFLRHDEKLR